MRLDLGVWWKTGSEPSQTWTKLTSSHIKFNWTIRHAKAGELKERKQRDGTLLCELNSNNFFFLYCGLTVGLACLVVCWQNIFIRSVRSLLYNTNQLVTHIVSHNACTMRTMKMMLQVAKTRKRKQMSQEFKGILKQKSWRAHQCQWWRMRPWIKLRQQKIFTTTIEWKERKVCKNCFIVAVNTIIFFSILTFGCGNKCGDSPLPLVKLNRLNYAPRGHKPGINSAKVRESATLLLFIACSWPTHLFPSLFVLRSEQTKAKGVNFLFFSCMSSWWCRQWKTRTHNEKISHNRPWREQQRNEMKWSKK